MDNEILALESFELKPIELQGNGICGNGIMGNGITSPIGEVDFDLYLNDLNI